MTLESALTLLELTPQSVLRVLHQCKVTPETTEVKKANFYSKDSKQQAPELPMDKEKLDQFRRLVRYWIGQLQFVHQKAKTVSPAMGLVNYRGQRWTEEFKPLFALYYMAAGLYIIPKFQDKELPGIDDFYDRIPATLAPSDPGFRITEKEERVLFSIGCFDTQKETIAAAKRGDAAAQCTLASLLYRWAPPEYNKQAKGWYELAAKQGNIEAMLDLGIYFEEKEMILKAAEAGSARAQYLLGREYYYDQKDSVRAIYWYEKAAQQNYLDAMNALSIIYYADTKHQDYAASAQWAAKICELGNTDMYHIETLMDLAFKANELCRNGSHTQGYQIMRPIAEYAYKKQDKRFAQPCALVGVSYAFGYGVAKDRSEGTKWLKRALELGYERAREILPTI